MLIVKKKHSARIEKNKLHALRILQTTLHAADGMRALLENNML